MIETFPNKIFNDSFYLAYWKSKNKNKICTTVHFVKKSDA